MPFVVREDVSGTPRKAMSQSRALKAWERHRGICVVCNRQIDGARDGWIVEHIRALAMGGTDDDTNTGPAHVNCADAKTTERDLPAIAKAKRQKAKHLGIKRPKGRPMPCGRASGWKKPFNGPPVPRQKGRRL